MRKRINLQMTLVMSVAVILTMLCAVIIFYESVKKEAFADLKIYNEIIYEDGSFLSGLDKEYDSGINSLETKWKYDNIRITVIRQDGVVIADSKVDPTTMDNHMSRSEVKNAIESGVGTGIRHSDTLDRDTFYYATLLDNGYVLRVSKESSSVVSILFDVIPISVAVVIIMVAICSGISTLFTKRIIEPIDEIANNLDNVNTENVYDEISPFIETIRKQHEDILRSASMRQEFTANVSHELKTPLAAISGYAELIETGMAKGEDATRFAGDIHRNSDRLLTLINDILKLSELDEGIHLGQLEQVNLYEVSIQCMDMLEITAEKNGVNVSISGCKDAYVTGNRQMLEELVYNLCDNGIRYNNPGGKVEISIDKKDNKVELTIKDDGIGISKENQERIFERFFRVDKSRSKAKGGTGLGLAIVKHIVACHNAVLELESEENKGTTIKVII